MDPHAARNARRKALKADLAEAYDDEEASPPEWLDILERTTQERAKLTSDVVRAVESFVTEPDIRKALAARDAFAARLTERVRVLNEEVKRLNLIAPHSRFTRGGVDAVETLRPLFRAARSGDTAT